MYGHNTINEFFKRQILIAVVGGLHIETFDYKVIRRYESTPFVFQINYIIFPNVALLYSGVRKPKMFFM